MLNSTWLGPVGETHTFSPAGSGLSPFQDNAATIFTIANTGAMLSIGQERARLKTALAVESSCASDFISASSRVSDPYNHPNGVARALNFHPRPLRGTRLEASVPKIKTVPEPRVAKYARQNEAQR